LAGLEPPKKNKTRDFMKQKRLSNYLLCLGVVASMALPGGAAEPQRGAKTARPNKNRAAEDDTLSLNRAIRLALDHNPQLQASDARKEAAVGRSVQARAWPNPELEVFSDDIPTRSGGLSQAKNMVGITQVVPYPGKKKADREIGAADAATGAAAWRLNRAELVRDVKIAYGLVQTAEGSAAVADDLVKVAAAAAAAAGKRNAAGEITLQEQLRAEIQLEQTKAEKVDALSQAAVARQEFVRLIGRPDLRDARLRDAPDESGKLSLVNSAPSAILAGHPAMVAARARRDQAVATLRRAGLEPRPDVTVGVAAGRDQAFGENLMALRLSIPLPLFDRSKGKQQEALAGVREAEAGIVATQQELLAAWRTAVARYKAAADQVAAHRERILPKSEEALRLVQTGFEEGKFNFIDYLDIQRTTAEARLAYQKKLFELNSARAELEAMAEAVPAGGK
jgi:cobalt-zinc-cadmium efflux system outer membrane protein